MPQVADSIGSACAAKVRPKRPLDGTNDRLATGIAHFAHWVPPFQRNSARWVYFSRTKAFAASHHKKIEKY